MRRYQVVTFVLCLFAIFTTPAVAIVTQSCAMCHGAGGISLRDDVPHLAGQHAVYLEKQMRDFQGGRTHPDFDLSTLDRDEMAAIGAFYAKQTLPKPRKVAQTSKAQLGERLYRHGDASHQITSCIACHGPDGLGNASAGFPTIVGQPMTYTINQLNAFKTNKRHNDMASVMQRICSHMSPDDMSDIAAYLAK